MTHVVRYLLVDLVIINDRAYPNESGNFRM